MGCTCPRGCHCPLSTAFKSPSSPCHAMVWQLITIILAILLYMCVFVRVWICAHVRICMCLLTRLTQVRPCSFNLFCSCRERKGGKKREELAESNLNYSTATYTTWYRLSAPCSQFMPTTVLQPPSPTHLPCRCFPSLHSLCSFLPSQSLPSCLLNH